MWSIIDRRGLSILAITMLVLAAKAAKAGENENNLVTNGSFECRSAGQPPRHIETLAPGATDLAGWEIVDPRPLPTLEVGKIDGGDRAAPWTIDWIGPTRWQAAHGDCCLDLDGGIRQTIKTEPGKTYELSFDFAANPELGPRTVDLRVLVDDERHDFAFDSTDHDPGSLGWKTQSIEFKAMRQETTLTFYNSRPTSQSAGVALDHVVVTDPRREPQRYRVTETTQGPVLLDTATGQTWRLAISEGQSVWLPIRREDSGPAR
jgi:choice-of-anchor C domain-containing protein